MADAQARAQYVSLVLEAVDPQDVQVDPQTGAVSPLMLWCVGALTQLSPDPSQVRLVVTGDFAWSARARLGPGEAAESFDLARGGGVVGAKTMPMPGGAVDVLVHASWFVEHDGGAPRPSELLTQRTVVHEAQHVAMGQQEQGYVCPDGTGWRMTNLLTWADAVLDEYRAELGVGADLRQDDDPWDAVTVLRGFRSDLARVVAEYREHQEVDRLIYEVGTVGLVSWRVLAYMVAAGRVLAGNEPVPADVVADPLWVRMAARRWDAFTEALALAEPGTVRMDPADLDVVVGRLAGVLGDWLGDLGFEWTDTADGGSWFGIAEGDLLDPAFMQVPTSGT